MIELIKSKQDLCTGCNKCVRECPMETANITYLDEEERIKVKIDASKCINCGRCIIMCKHDARYYEDDTIKFFSDLESGIPISLIAAPSIRTNIPEYKRLFTYLKHSGIDKIYDVSLGADICIWTHVRYLENNKSEPLITQPCPVIVSYCETYRHELLDKLSPLHSPMACTAIYMKEYEGILGQIAALSPCIAKSAEFNDTGLVHYNVTFARILQYLDNNNITLPNEETEFDHNESGLGSVFPMPGGLKENIDFYFDKSIHIVQAEGSGVFKKLDTYAQTPSHLLPKLFDCLNCSEGCNVGPAVHKEKNIFEIGSVMKSQRNAADDVKRRDWLMDLHRSFDEKLELSLFRRDYKKNDHTHKTISEADINHAFELLRKTDYDKQHIDCSACGSATCYDMARKIALGVNIASNCMVLAMETAKSEHMENIAAHAQIASMEKLSEADKRIRLLLDANPHINVLFNDKFEVLDCNPAALKFMGFDTKQELVDGFLERILESIPEYQTSGRLSVPLSERFANVIRDGSDNFETNLIIKGVMRTLDVNFKRIPYAESFAVVGYFYDMTEIHEREMELERARVEAEKQRLEAEAANKAKSAFLSTMSHEIRTPMNAILGITEVQLQNPSHDEETREALGKIYSSGDMLLGIINDILDLSKIESGKLELVYDRYEIASLISDSAQLNMMRIGSKPIEFEINLDENLPTVLLGDELRVKQILNNILSNAFKYTDAGTVTLTIKLDESSDIFSDSDHVPILIIISDTGHGMSIEQVNKLFDEYTRFNADANRTTEGTGLGMSITQKLIDLMNGTIHVDSELNIGTTVYVRIPQTRVGPSVLGNEMVENLRKFRTIGRARNRLALIAREPMPYGSVLVVDDVDTNIYVARGLLSPYGLQVDHAESGFIAIEKIKSGRVYDIIFMDHMMPKMDGMEATKIIRDMGYERSIVALTANAVSGQADLFLSNGFDDFIAKPIDVRQLNSVLNRLIRDKQSPELINETRMQTSMSPDTVTDASSKIAIGPRFAEVFLRDANKALSTLDSFMEKRGEYNESDIRSYTICVHGIKTALASIGSTDLSEKAFELEIASRNLDLDTITFESALFIEKLRSLVDELSSGILKKTNLSDSLDDNLPSVREALGRIKVACNDFDEKLIEDSISEFLGTALTQQIQELFESIAAHLLHSDFDDIVALIDDFMGDE